MANAYDQINEVISLRNEVARLQQKLDGLKKQAVPPQEPEKREMPSEPLPPHYEKETGSVSAITVPHRRRETEIDYPWGFVLKIGIGVLIVGLIFIVVYFMRSKKGGRRRGAWVEMPKMPARGEQRQFLRKLRCSKAG